MKTDKAYGRANYTLRRGGCRLACKTQNGLCGGWFIIWTHALQTLLWGKRIKVCEQLQHCISNMSVCRRNTLFLVWAWECIMDSTLDEKHNEALIELCLMQAGPTSTSDQGTSMKQSQNQSQANQNQRTNKKKKKGRRWHWLNAAFKSWPDLICDSLDANSVDVEALRDKIEHCEVLSVCVQHLKLKRQM